MLGVRYVAPYLVDVFYDSVDALLHFTVRFSLSDAYPYLFRFMYLILEDLESNSVYFVLSVP